MIHLHSPSVLLDAMCKSHTDIGVVPKCSLSPGRFFSQWRHGGIQKLIIHADIWHQCILFLKHYENTCLILKGNDEGIY